MPPLPKRPCKGTGCRNLAEGRFCTTCQAAGESKERRGSSHSRGYDAVWNRFRHWFIQRHPVCADCGRKATTDVHHIVKLRDRPDLRLVESNCLGLDHECHSKRTAKGE